MKPAAVILLVIGYITAGVLTVRQQIRYRPDWEADPASALIYVVLWPATITTKIRGRNG